MEKGKLIVIEGTDCSGKETQSRKLIEKLNNEGMPTEYFSFPKYDTPSGKIVGLSYLGKTYLAEELINQHKQEILQKINVKERNIDEKVLIQIVLDEVISSLSRGWFNEGAPNVDPKVSSLYYAADRKYNLPKIEEIIANGTNVVLDRYTYSNMAHQGGKIADDLERQAMYSWISKLEFDFLDLPQSDIKLFLHMPTDYSVILGRNRGEKLDEHESDINHLYQAERAYLEVADIYDFHTIECVNATTRLPIIEDIKSPNTIGEEVYNVVKKKLQMR